MLNKINLLRFLIVVLFLSTIAIATETTWRHSGFEISGYDISGASTYNLTEIRKIEFGWNTSIPAVSDTSRAVMYYDDNQKGIMQSVNGGAYQTIVTNETVNFVTGNASNLTSGTMNLTHLNYSRVYAYNSVQQDNIASDTATQVILDVEGYDLNNNFAANIFTVPRNGFYRINAQVAWLNFIASKPYVVRIYKNGANIFDNYAHSGTYVGNIITPHISIEVKLNAGDTISMYAQNIDGAGTADIAANTGTETFLQISEVGAP